MFTKLKEEDFLRLSVVSDFTINRLLHEVNVITNDSYLIEEIILVDKKLFSTKEYTLYRVYKIFDKPNVQGINFIGSDNNLINKVDKTIICGYLSGIISGFNFGK